MGVINGDTRSLLWLILWVYTHITNNRVCFFGQLSLSSVVVTISGELIHGYVPGASNKSQKTADRQIQP